MKVFQLLALAGVTDALRTNTRRGSIQKIIGLLNDMIRDNTKNRRETEGTCEKQACWYKTFKKNKNEEIQTQETNIQTYRETRETSAGSHGSNAANAQNKIADLKETQETLEGATSQRLGDKADFVKEETKLTTAVSALKSALNTLDPANKKDANFAEIKTTMASLQAQFPNKKFVGGEVMSLLQDDKLPYESYTSQSGQIVGMLGQMRDEFAEDLKSAQDEESKAATAFATLENTLNERIGDLETEIGFLQESASGAASSAASAKEMLDKATTALANANEALMQANKDSQTDAQSCKVRLSEIADEAEALKLTLGVLDSDDAHGSFSAQSNGGSLGVSLLQVSPPSQQARMALILQRSGVTSKAIAQLKAKTGEDFFETIRVEIEKMLVAMKESQTADNAMREGCDGEKFALNQEKDNIAADTTKANGENSRLDAAIKAAKAQIDSTKESITKMNKDQADRSVLREEQQQTYNDVTANDVEVMGLLDEAAEVLKKHMKKVNARKSLLSMETGDDQNVKPSLAKAEKTDFNSATGPLGLIRKLKSEVDREMKENQRNEVNQEREYVAETKKYQKNLASTKEELAALQGQMSDDLAEQSSVQEALNLLSRADRTNSNAIAAHKNNCRDIFDNFDSRKTNRIQEMQSLREAKQQIMGAKGTGMTV